jgi:chromosome segregation ATPase
MDFFSIGNLLTIFLSIGILLVYRVLDSNNRSLDKVRRYVQTAQKELDAFLVERTQGLKDFTIELQVHENTGKQIIQRVKAAEEELQAKAANIEALTDRLVKLHSMVENLEQMSTRVDENLNRLKEESEFVDKVGRRIKAAVEQMNTIEADIPKLVSQFGVKNQEELKKSLELYHSFVDEEKTKLEHKNAEALQRIDQFQKFLQGLDAKKQSFVQEAQKSLQEVANKSYDKMVHDVKNLEKEWQSLEKNFSQTLKQHALAVNKVADDVLGKAIEESRQKSKEAHDLILNQFAQVEKTFKEFEEGLRYKFGQLEQVEKDFDGLEANLRRLMGQETELIKKDINDQTLLMQQELERYRQSHHQQIQNLSQAMKQLEDELDALKARAYDNVSEKLKVFEDEFFSDLQRRDAAMTQSFEELQKRIEVKVLSVDQDVARSLETSARMWQDKLKEQLAQLQGIANEQIAKVETSLGSWREKMEDQWNRTLNSNDERLKLFSDELIKTTQEWQKRIENETARRDLALREGLSQVERDLETRTRGLVDLVESNRSDVLNRLETTKSDLGVWQSRLTAQFKSIESEQLEQYQNFKQFIQDKINGLKEEFARQRDDLIFATQEERSTMKRELKELEDGLNSLVQNLHNKTESALEESKKNYESFILEFQRKMRELQADQDVVIKDFKAAMNDNKEKSEALQKKLFGKIEDHYNLLVVNLEEIDKRLKNFLNQTKLFERSDALKAELNEAIEDLRTQIEKVSLQRKDLFEMENQMARIKKIHEENSERLNRFLAEKKKLEAMDNDFQKIINLSQSMELRLQQVTNSHDTLQQIQFEIRKLEEYTKEVDAQLERLDRKRQILDSTTEGVDRNFNLITQMERQIKEVQGVIGALPAQVDDIQRKVRTLIQSKSETEAAIQLAGKLNAILQDLEARMAKIEKAREWLAATETRLQEISRQSDEQLKVLAAINKSDKSKSSGNAAGDIRQVVLKLAHQGWTKGDIARVTKLSVGEVELILEMETTG